VRLVPPPRIDGAARPPGSKSLTNRALICAALADGPSTLRNASLSDDSRLLVGALARFGHHLRLQGSSIEVTPREPRAGADRETFYLGNAGTAVRFWIAFLCTQRGKFLVDGDARMRQRPVADLLDALTRLGARVKSVFGNGSLPVAVDADGMEGGRTTIRADVSSQFVSALLLAAPRCSNGLQLELEGAPTSEPYLEMTAKVMRGFGAAVERHGRGGFSVAPSGPYRGTQFEVEPDASGAAYLLSLAAVTGGRVRVDGLGTSSVQGDVRFADLLEQMGCRIERAPASLTAVGGPLRGIDVDMNDIPDTVQTLAVVSLFAKGPTRIRNVPNLRVKETDRIGALAKELSKLGARVEESPDGLTIHPPAEVSPARIAAYGDHRMVMSFAVAAARVPGIELEDPACVAKSFPGFFDLLEALGVSHQGSTLV